MERRISTSKNALSASRSAEFSAQESTSGHSAASFSKHSAMAKLSSVTRTTSNSVILLGGAAEPDAAVAAAHRLHKAILDQRLKDLEQEKLGYGVRVGDLRESGSGGRRWRRNTSVCASRSWSVASAAFSGVLAEALDQS